MFCFAIIQKERLNMDKETEDDRTKEIVGEIGRNKAERYSAYVAP